MRLIENAVAAPLDHLTTARPETVGGRARHRRGWYTRRALAATDVAGLSIAFVTSTIAFADRRPIGDHVSLSVEVCLFFLTLPLWLVFARALGLYDRDDARADHSTADETFGVINLVTRNLDGLGRRLDDRACPARTRSVDQFLGVGSRAGVARSRRCSDDRPPTAGLRPERRRDRRRPCRAARRAQDPAAPGVRDQGGRVRRRQPPRGRPEIADLPLLGGLDDVAGIVENKRSTASSSPSRARLTIRPCRSSVRFETRTSSWISCRASSSSSGRADIHLLEGLHSSPSPARLRRSSRITKRVVDVVGATVLLVLTAPVFVIAAIRISRESPGPVFFGRQGWA